MERIRQLAVVLVLGAAAQAPAYAQESSAAPTSHYATVNGVKLHYLSAGKGPAVVLLHGYAETSHMWLPLIAGLAKTHLVIAPDLRGAGDSDKPETGYDKKSMAQDIHALVESLGEEQITIVGHDIGLMVAYAYAAQFRNQVRSVVLMDAFLPGVGNWKDVWLLRDLWHFHFYGETPLKLVDGRERIYFEHFWNDFAADRTHSVPEADRRFYAKAYAQPGGMRAGFEYFKSFPQDAVDFEGLAKTRLSMPMLVLTGEKASGNFLIEQGRLVATDVQGVVIKGSGHWLMEEAPGQVIPLLIAFINDDGGPRTQAPRQRLTPADIAARKSVGAGAGSSGLVGVQTTVLKGDPTKPGLYTILLRVPANTRIEAHEHPDDRTATVISGTWFFGYGERFDDSALTELAPGSFYTEPPNEAHFARTGDTPAVILVSGYGPTGTTYRDRTE